MNDNDEKEKSRMTQRKNVEDIVGMRGRRGGEFAGDAASNSLSFFFLFNRFLNCFWSSGLRAQMVFIYLDHNLRCYAFVCVCVCVCLMKDDLYYISNAVLK